MNAKSRNSQRKWRYSRPARPAWLEAVLAVIIAVAAHIVFFGVFQYKEPGSGGIRQGAMVTLYNLNTLSSTEREQALKWIERHDPKLAVRGDSPAGFSSFLPKEKKRKVTVEQFKAVIDLPEKKQITYKAFKTAQAAMPGIPETSDVSGKYLQKTAVLDSMGGKVDVDMSKITPIAAGTSMFVIRGKGDYKRVETLKSCAAEQDARAAEILLDAGFDENEHLTVIWLKGEK